jgi:predicted DCC family thiol-disulfide oxidoreductase YuxK
MNSPSIILFDGQCNVCNTFVQFVIRRDPTGKFQFAPLQSEQAARALQAAAFKATFNDQPVRVCVSTSSMPPTSPPTSSTTLTPLQTAPQTSQQTAPQTAPQTSSPTPPQTSPTPPQTSLTPPPLDSIMLICQGKVLLRSDAVLAIARGLRFPWPLLTVFRIVPRPIRDGAYRIFARNRYRWFGQCNMGA